LFEEGEFDYGEADADEGWRTFGFVVRLEHRDLREIFAFLGVPPSHALKALTGAAFAKMLCKILSHSALRVKILTTKDLLPFLRLLRAYFRNPGLWNTLCWLAVRC
jgi:hypothetical protein